MKRSILASRPKIRDKLKTHHLKSLMRHVEEGGILQIHDDVPGDIREQLYREEH